MDPNFGDVFDIIAKFDSTFCEEISVHMCRSGSRAGGTNALMTRRTTGAWKSLKMQVCAPRVHLVVALFQSSCVFACV